MSVKYLHKIYNRLLKLVGVILLIGINSCQEVYEIDDLDIDEKIPVMDGIITDGNDVCSIQLCWATPFNEKNTEYISDARVFLLDTSGNSESLTLRNKGRYFTSSEGITRKIGEKYKIQVHLNGQIYETPFEEIPEPVLLDSIYPEYKEKEEIVYNTYGDIVDLDKTKGIRIMHIMGEDIQETNFFRFKFRVVSQIRYGADYRWEIGTFNSRVKFVSVKPVQVEHKLNRYESIFLVCLDVAVIGANIVIRSDGWVIETTSLTINSNTYNYYDAIKTQIDADNRVFDPIPFQIEGNLTCISDSSEKILGVIEFASKKVDYHAVWWDGVSRDQFKNIRLDSYEMPGSSGSSSIMPDFYIDFSQIPYAR